jgi:hypothetical protein
MTRNPYLAHGAVLISSALLLLTPGFGIAQTAATATLLGTVTDPSGAAVAGATIELTDQSVTKLAGKW